MLTSAANLSHKAETENTNRDPLFRQIHMRCGCISESDFRGINLLCLSTALQQSMVCINLYNLQSGQEVTVCHHQKELQFILCLFFLQTSCWILFSSASMFSRSCLQSSICSLFSSLVGWGLQCRETSKVSVHYLLLSCNNIYILIA